MADTFTIFKKEMQSNINKYYYYLSNPDILIYDFFERCMEDNGYIHFIDTVMTTRSYNFFFDHLPPSNVFDIDAFEYKYDLARLKIFLELDKNCDISENAMLSGWYDEACKMLVTYELCNDNLLMIENFIKLIQREHEKFGIATRHRLGIPTILLYNDASSSDLNCDLINLLIDKKYMNVVSHTNIIHVIIEIILNEVGNKEYANRILKSINYAKITDPKLDTTMLDNKIKKLQEFVAT